MGKIIKCSIVIYDDFGNVLVAERGKKAERVWGLFGKEIKGKETTEKCICKAVDKDVKCTVFDLQPFKEYSVNDEESTSMMVFKGTVKEYLTCHKTINSVKWINKKELSDYNFNEEDLQILKDYFKI